MTIRRAPAARLSGPREAPPRRIAVLLVALAAVPAVVPGAQTAAAAPGGFQYVEGVRISNSGGSLSDYQVLLVLDTQQLIAESKMRPDCADVRFMDSDGSTALDFWLEAGCGTSSTRLWMQVPTIPSGNKTVVIRYGNPTASNASNGTATFEFFDDFDDGQLDGTKWRVLAGTVAEQNGYLRVGPGSGNNLVFSQQPVGVDVAVEALVWKDPNSPDEVNIEGRADATRSASYQGIHYQGQLRIVRNGVDLANRAQPIDAGVWYPSSLRMFGTSPARLTSVLNGETLTANDSNGLSNGYVGAATWNEQERLDNFRVRKYTEPEPVATIVGPGEPPEPPRNLAARPGFAPGDLVLSWDPSPKSEYVANYTIYRSAHQQGPREYLARIPGNATGFTDRGLTPGVRYYYNVTAANALGEGTPGQASSRAALLPSSIPTIVGDFGDADGDIVPEKVEEQCGRQVVRDALSKLQGDDGPLLGTCATPSDYAPPWWRVDSDDDLVVDPAEPGLCSVEDQNDPMDGTCMGGDYAPPGMPRPPIQSESVPLIYVRPGDSLRVGLASDQAEWFSIFVDGVNPSQVYTLAAQLAASPVPVTVAEGVASQTSTGGAAGTGSVDFVVPLTEGVWRVLLKGAPVAQLEVFRDLTGSEAYSDAMTSPQPRPYYGYYSYQNRPCDYSSVKLYDGSYGRTVEGNFRYDSLAASWDLETGTGSCRRLFPEVLNFAIDAFYPERSENSATVAVSVAAETPAEKCVSGECRRFRFVNPTVFVFSDQVGEVRDATRVSYDRGDGPLDEFQAVFKAGAFLVDKFLAASVRVAWAVSGLQLFEILTSSPKVDVAFGTGNQQTRCSDGRFCGFVQWNTELWTARGDKVNDVFGFEFTLKKDSSQWQNPTTHELSLYARPAGNFHYIHTVRGDPSCHCVLKTMPDSRTHFMPTLGIPIRISLGS